MSQELIYTSVPRGLRPGATGFCTVAMTAGMPATLAERLELLGGYRPVFPLGDPQAGNNPVIWAHWLIMVGGQPRNVLSRVAFAGADYSSRSNKFAHHLVVAPSERAPAGPAWVLARPGLMKTAWAQEPKLLPAGPAVPAGDRPPAPCTAWASTAGDAGWAGALADSFRNDASKLAYLVFRPGAEMLPLIEEALALLPAAMRWRVTFNTYFTELPMETTCAWRCVVAGTPAAKEALRAAGRALVIDLTKPLPAPPETPLTEAARTGRVVAVATPASPAARTADDGAPSGFHAGSRADGAGVSAVPGRPRRRLGAVADVGEYELEDTDFGDGQVKVAVADTPARYAAGPRPRRVWPWIATTIAFACLSVALGVALLLALQARPPNVSKQSSDAQVKDSGDELRAGDQKHSRPVTQPAASLLRAPASAGASVGGSAERSTIGQAQSSPPSGAAGAPTRDRQAPIDATQASATPRAPEPPAPLATQQADEGARRRDSRSPEQPVSESHTGAEASATRRSAPAAGAVANADPRRPQGAARTQEIQTPVMEYSELPQCELPELALGQTMNLQDAARGDHFTVMFPNGTQSYSVPDGAEELTATNDFPWMITVHVSYPKRSGLIDGKFEAAIAAFEVKEGKLKFSKLDPWNAADRLYVRIFETLELSTLLARANGKPVALIRFRRKLKTALASLQLGEGPSYLTGFPAQMGEMLSIGMPEGDLNGWTVAEPRPTRETFTRDHIAPAAEPLAFTISLDTSTVASKGRPSINSTWDRRPLRAEYDEALTKMRDLHATKEERDRLDNEIADLDTKRGKERDNAKIARLEQTRKALVDAREHFDACRSRYKAYEALGELRLPIRLPNGLAIGLVAIMPPSSTTADLVDKDDRSVFRP